MGRVPALRAESVFYWIRQEKRKRKDAIAKLEYKTMYFYTEAMKSVKKDDGHEDDLPPLPVHSFTNEDNKDEKDYNDENINHEDNFYSQVKSLDVSLVTGQQITEVGESSGADANMISTDGNRAARHAPGIALAAVVQTAAKADGKNVADSVQHVATEMNERRALTNTANEYMVK